MVKNDEKSSFLVFFLEGAVGLGQKCLSFAVKLDGFDENGENGENHDFRPF